VLAKASGYPSGLEEAIVYVEAVKARVYVEAVKAIGVEEKVVHAKAVDLSKAIDHADAVVLV